MADITSVQGIWDNLLSYIHEKYNFLVFLAVYAIIITIYSIFVWKFYRFMAKKDVIELNLWRYIKTEENIIRKFIASVFYIVEYIIVIPFLVFFWYAILSLFFLVLAKEQTLANILLIGMSIVAAVRITAYFNEDLSNDIAKLFPLTLLAVFLMTPNFFSVNTLIDRIKEIPDFLYQMAYYIIFVVILEIILRVLAVIKQLFSPPEEDDYEEEELPKK